MNTQIIRKRLFCVTGVSVIGELIPRQLMCVTGAFTESTREGAQLHKIMQFLHFCSPQSKNAAFLSKQAHNVGNRLV